MCRRLHWRNSRSAAPGKSLRSFANACSSHAFGSAHGTPAEAPATHAHRDAGWRFTASLSRPRAVCLPVLGNASVYRRARTTESCAWREPLLIWSRAPRLGPITWRRRWVIAHGLKSSATPSRHGRERQRMQIVSGRRSWAKSATQMARILDTATGKYRACSDP